MALNYDQLVRITKEVILGVDPREPDTREEAAYRAETEKRKKEADKKGIMLTIPPE